MKRNIITTFLTGTPSSTYSVTNGYSVGSEWVNTNNGNRFYHKTDGNWVPLNVESPFYIQGGTISAFETTSSVYRTGNIGIGTASPSTKLHIFSTQSGVFRLQDGTQANGYVLKSDANGVATWASFSSSTYSTSIYWYTENTTPPSTAPVATGAGSIAIGNNAEALSSNMFVYGESAGITATGSEYSNLLGFFSGFQSNGSSQSNFLGNYAGFQSPNSSYSNFIGNYAGFQSQNSQNSNFIGNKAGLQSSNVSNSNFFGNDAGVQSSNVSNSNFFGEAAGKTAPNAIFSNFFGHYAGQGANNSDNSNFFGNNAGQGAYGAGNSNFLGALAGKDAFGASHSNFLGRGSGQNAYGSNNSNFIGNLAGNLAISAYNSNFIGQNSGKDASYANNSNFLGFSAGENSVFANNSNFIGQYAGQDAYSANNSNFIGNNAGQNADNANNSNFIGERAGKGVKQGNNSNFLGQGAGQIDDSIYIDYDGITYNFFSYQGGNNSNFIGINSGLNSVSNNSNFIGQNSGELTFLAHYSNFFGFYAGAGANSANNSNFFGYAAGQNAINANNSNLFGFSAGKSFTSNNIGSNNIVIGTNISLPDGATNSINIGGVLFGLNTYSDTIGNPSIVAQPNGRIGINVVNPTTNLHVYGTQSGAFRLEDTTQGNGYILTSDANGVASWTSSLTGLSLLGNSEVISASVSATASLVVYDYSLSSLWYHATASTNFTANFTNLPTTNNRVLSTTIVISQGATAYIPNIVQIAGVTQSIKWAGGTQSGTANSLDLISFNFIRTGNAWTSVIGQIAPFS